MKTKKAKFYFEPKNSITTHREFTDELINYCNENKKDLTIIHEGMEPIAIIDGIKYLCILEPPRLINMPIFSYGFKWVYIYKYE